MLSYVIAASAALDSLAQTASADGQIGAAKIAIVGVLFTAILGAWGVYHRARLDRQLATLKSDHEVRLLKLEDVQARARLDAEVRAKLNEENWKRMLEEFRELKNIAAELIDTLIAICAFGHEQDDEHVLHQTMAVVKLHREFRDKMKPLFGEIRSADYDRLEAFHRYQVKVLLDIGRTKADRIAKRSEMEVHADELRRKKDLLEAFVSAFLQPRADSLRVS